MIRTFHKLRLRFGTWPLERKVVLWGVILVVPFIVISVYFLITLNGFFVSYDRIMQNVAQVNNYNIVFKENVDTVMYQMVARALHQDEVGSVVGMNSPGEMIETAKNDFVQLQQETVSQEAKDRVSSVLNLLDALAGYVDELDTTVTDSGSYDDNMLRLDSDVYIMTDLIQERISEYIYYETNSMGQVRLALTRQIGIITTIVIITLILVCVLAAILSVIIIREQRRARDLEMNLLQVQINPHFLYNTLDNIIWMTEDDRKEDIADIVMHLSEFFRTTLSGGRTMIHLKEEFHHVEAYLQIQSYRYRDLLHFKMELPPQLEDVMIIKMTLQPIVENALYHGIKNKREGGTIWIRAEEQAGEICLTVSDDGVGMQEEELLRLSKAVEGMGRVKETAGGVGLLNVSERLRMHYGDRYGLNIASVYGEGTVVTIRIPKEEERKNSTYSVKY